MKRDSLLLYLVTDSGLLRGREMKEVVLAAVAGGVTMVQLREKQASTRDFVDLARQLKEALSDRGVPLLINDRIDVAMAVDADGVHIGQSDMPYAMARQMLGPEKIIGLSVENMQQVEESNLLDCDYIGISPVFSTPTKSDTATPFGLSGLRHAVRLSAHPTVAIGGMNLQTAQEVMCCGTDGIAVVSAIMSAEDPCIATSHLLNKVSKIKH